jgi:perosamine synthetase
VITKIPIARPVLGRAEQEAAIAAMSSGWVSQGPQCVAFERLMAELIGVRHARAVNSGTSAIHLALVACGVGPGDEVIVPAFTCVATLNPLEHIGAFPVLVDVERTSFGLDPNLLPDAITNRTRAIILVHPFGLAADVETTRQHADRHGLVLIEDTALGLGAKVGDRMAGSFGEAACFSFHPRKMITTGEGGMVVTDSEEIAERVGRLRNYGASTQAWARHQGELFELPAYEEAGYNYKLTDIQAAIGRQQASRLSDFISMRQQIAARYDEALSGLDWLRLPARPPGRTHVHQSYVCLVDPPGADVDALSAVRRRLWQHLAASGIATVQGAQAMNTIAYYQRKYRWKPADHPCALYADLASVALPIFPGLTEDEQEAVVSCVRSFRP